MLSHFLPNFDQGPVPKIAGKSPENKGLLFHLEWDIVSFMFTKFCGSDDGYL